MPARHRPVQFPPSSDGPQISSPSSVAPSSSGLQSTGVTIPRLRTRCNGLEDPRTGLGRSADRGGVRGRDGPVSGLWGCGAPESREENATKVKASATRPEDERGARRRPVGTPCDRSVRAVSPILGLPGSVRFS
jgi:hypothetical protein